MPAKLRWKPNQYGTCIRGISINIDVWTWLKKQPARASGWIEQQARDAMKLEEVDDLRRQLFDKKAECARLADILNSIGVDTARK